MFSGVITLSSIIWPSSGAFTDVIRKMDNPTKPKICQLSAGIHIILPSYYSPRSMGMLDPETTDGRVIFFLPWEGKECCWWPLSAWCEASVLYGCM